MCLRLKFCTHQRVCILYFLKKVKFVVPQCPSLFIISYFQCPDFVRASMNSDEVVVSPHNKTHCVNVQCTVFSASNTYSPVYFRSIYLCSARTMNQIIYLQTSPQGFVVAKSLHTAQNRIWPRGGAAGATWFFT